MRFAAGDMVGIVIRASQRLLSDHHLSRFHRHRHGIIDLQTHTFDGTFSDRGDKLKVADFYRHFRHGLSLRDIRHGAFELISRAELHVNLLIVNVIYYGCPALLVSVGH